MPSLPGRRGGGVTSYLALVNWLLRKYADEQSLSNQDVAFDSATQGVDETETDLYDQLKTLRGLCGYIHTAGQAMSLFMQGLWREVRTEVRDHKRTSLPVEQSGQYAQRRGDVARRRIAER